ncbi:MAG: acetyl-CoA carboxylase, biotin carboxyl carrier protein [Cyanobacteria bacterium QS_8_64_29]|nr:MAG: acetyl-CoA carboxylase, biotin carboxyl carrier protein [Cyanobacteria bacterium QS_8_64_29]
MPVDFDRLRELLADLARTDIAELNLKSEDFELTVRKGTGGPAVAGTQALERAPSPAAEPAPAAAPAAEPQAAPSDAAEQWQEITSPMVGTFYRAPSPDEDPFVEVGDRVRPDQTVCIIEAMKLMNEVEAEVGGQIVEIAVENGEPIEYGQVLMRVKPE